SDIVRSPFLVSYKNDHLRSPKASRETREVVKDHKHGPYNPEDLREKLATGVCVDRKVERQKKQQVF
ncbi:hypothetical protein AVEN_250979-1, partial [Araneus ventricosus]